MTRLPVAVEDHLKVIYLLEREVGRATTGAVAERLGISSPSVSETVGRLRRDHLVAAGPGLALTDAGRRRALSVIRRHRVVETFLHRVLDLGLHELHAEAELLEHVISDRVLDRLDDLLGHPQVDPHGDPIPRDGHVHDEAWPPSLDTAQAGERFVVERVSDRDVDALEHLAAHGVVPGARLTVRERDPFGGGLEVVVHGRGPAGDAGDGTPLRLAPRLLALVHGHVSVPEGAA